MTLGPGDALFGQDGTGGAIGPLPGMDLPVVRLPIIGPDGEIAGLDEFESDLDAGPGPGGPPAGPPFPPAQTWQTGPGPGPGSPDASAVPAPPPGLAQPRPGAPAGADHASATPAPPRAVTSPAETGWGSSPGPAGRVPGVPAQVLRHPHRPAARPRVTDEPGILGLSRRSRSRLGSRLFAAFFAFVFAVILVQMIVALLAA